MLLFRPDAVMVWRNDEVRKRLRWYRSVMLNNTPAKFMILKTIPVDIDLDKASVDELWRLNDELHVDSSRLFEEYFEKGSRGIETRFTEPSFLDLKIELARRMLKSCHFCEWRCGIDRTRGQRGVCKLDHRAYISSFFHHYGEEAPLIGVEGKGGSGTIFFTSCNFHCVFCQNWDISQPAGGVEEAGVESDARRLATIAKRLRLEGAANINYVGGEPTPNLHVILESLKHLDVNVPILWNSNMYMSEEAMKLLVDVIDIWLPDFKYWSNECARRLSRVGVKKGYREVVTRNHLIASENGDMIIRHLVMPNHIECDTKPILQWIADHIGDKVLVNIMEQYRPEYRVVMKPHLYRDISRRLYGEEIAEAYNYAKMLGIIYEPVS
ncbi:MAG: radical SAM protein [Candidatus Caldarchaeales archaeon]